MNPTWWFLGGLAAIIVGVGMKSIPDALVIGGTFATVIGLTMSAGKVFVESRKREQRNDESE